MLSFVRSGQCAIEVGQISSGSTGGHRSVDTEGTAWPEVERALCIRIEQPGLWHKPRRKSNTKDYVTTFVCPSIE